MDLTKILYFKAVVDAGSLSSAASLIGLSQPALSLQIQNLEYELGLKLFVRHNRGLILTEEGHALKERAILLEEWLKETKSTLEGMTTAEGKIHVGTYTTASSYLLTPVLGKFFEKYPKIEISYNYSSTEELLRKVKNLELDCALISEIPQTNGLTVEAIYENELLLVCSCRNKTIASEITKEELSSFPFLSYPLRTDFCYREVEKRFGKYLKQARVPIESESFDTLKQSVLNDLGITFMPEYLIRQELKDKKLRKIKIKAPELTIVFSLVTKEGKKLSPRMEEFRNFLKTSL